MSSLDFSPMGRGLDAIMAGWKWNSGHLLHTLGLVFSLLLAYALARGIYLIWFHPLSAFPGPPLLSAVYFPNPYSNFMKGTWIRQVAKLHRKYGPVVRIGPNHIAVDGTIGWPEVFGHRKGGKEEFRKLPGIFPGDEASILVANREVHRRQRRQLSHAFSDAALIDQESVIIKYVDMLIDRLAERAKDGAPINIVPWMNYTTFDIIGDLAFSESFDSLKNNGYHPWVLSIFQGIRSAARRRFFQHYPILGWISDTFSSSPADEHLLKIRSYARNKAQSRMDLGPEPVSSHRDFMSYMMRKTRDGSDSMRDSEILVNSPAIIIAGSETTATALAGFHFYMSKNPRALSRLAEEIRAAFESESDINLRSTSSLQYLQACINETLRVYPPAAETSARISPGDFVDGKYVPAGTLVSVYQWATFRNPANFVEPDSFIPERWLPATHAHYEARFEADNRAAFKPFSVGPRDCIGKNLAYSELRLIISRIVYHFDFELAFEQDGWHDNQKTFLLWNKSPLYVRLQQRKE